MSKEYHDPEYERAMLRAEWYKFVRNFLIPLLGFFMFACFLCGLALLLAWTIHHL